jgi:hypothetical protein
MPVKSVQSTSNKYTRTFIQIDDDGNPDIGTTFTLYDCQAITGWTRDFGETTRIKVKSPVEYGKFLTKETIAGAPGDPTFDVVAFTSEELDWLLELDCPVDFQVHYGRCSSPGDLTGYRKIRHFHQSTKSSEGEENVDFIGEEEFQAVTQNVSFSATEIITILQTTLASSASGITETQALNAIDVLSEGRCEGDCGQSIKKCYWCVTVADANYLSATANVWYSQDGAGTWTVTAVDPFSENSALCSEVVILTGETYPRIIVFRGNISGSYGARCSVSDDWGASWSEVDMGGNSNGSYVTSAHAFGPGLILTSGNGGYAYKSEDKGTSWTEYDNTETGTSQNLWDIHTPNGQDYFACGENNVITWSDDAGVTWNATTITGPSAGTTLWTIQAATEYRLIVGGDIDGSNDVLWITEDRGINWNDLDFTGSTTASGQVRRVRVTDKAPTQHWLFIHGVNNGSTQRWGPGTNTWRVFRTLDGGGSFERESLVSNLGYNDLAVCNINTAFVCGETVGGIAIVHKMQPS